MAIIHKNIEAGEKAGIKFGSSGELFITLGVIDERTNVSVKKEFLIDSGFNGYLQLSSWSAEELNIKIIKNVETRGFDNIPKNIGLAEAKINLLDIELPHIPIHVVPNGLFLLGTKFLKYLSGMIIIDYSKDICTITMDKKVQKKVHKAVERYQK